MEKTTAEKWQIALRIAGGICGVLLIVLAIYNFGTLSLSEPLDIILPIYYV